jgi:hypothetical protein
VHPIVTFSAPLGCSFLSFSPTGLSLFTANSKGDVQNVWDLMRIHYNRASLLQAPSSSGAESEGVQGIRQIANFSRMTVASVVDVSWTRPTGERLAMVTERGTVHVRDLPPTAFLWPPPRRRAKAGKSTKTAAVPPSSSSSETPASTISAVATNALSSAIEVARPLLDRSQRRGSANNQQMLRGPGIVEQASHGGKALAAGISHSLGKTGSAIHQLRQTGESRVSLPTMILPPRPGCITWIGGRRQKQDQQQQQQHLYVTGDGLVRTFPNRNRKSAMTLEQQRTPYLSRYKDFKLPHLPDNALAPAVSEFLDLGGQLGLTEEDLDTAGVLPTTAVHKAPSPLSSAATAAHDPPNSSIPEAEIESSAPYQPFHTDRRVALYEYGRTTQVPAATELPTVSVLLTEGRPVHKPDSTPAASRLRAAQGSRGSQASVGWTFGHHIDAVKLDLGIPPLPDDEGSINGLAESRALPASAIERVLQHVGDNDEQIVVTTRRRRGVGRSESGQGDEDGFFEDDCEVLDFADQRV